MSAGAPPTLGDVLPDVSEEEWGIALRVVAAVAALPPEAYASKPVRAFRVAVVPLVNRLHAAMHGEARAASDAKRESVHSGALKKQQQKALDAAFINKTKLRATRLAKLAELSTQESEGTGTLLMIPDGIADDSVVTTTGAGYAAPRALTDAPLPSAVPGASMGDMHDDDAAASVIHTAVAATTTGAEHCAPKPAVLTDTADDAADTSAPLPAAPTPVAAGVPATGEEEESTPQLFKHRGCYTCKRRFNVLHHFYSSMCPDCAALNWLKRNQTVDLRGRIALVTGARVKIGFHVALKLLRAGAHVIATSRFPHDTAERYAAQPDFGVWKDRLHVYGIDFRDIQALEAFCAFMYREYTHLDILINNACQTVRRPPAYYAHMMPKETAPLDALPPALQPLVQRDHKLYAGMRSLTAGPGAAMSSMSRAALPDAAAPKAGAGASSAADVPSAVACSNEKAAEDATLLMHVDSASSAETSHPHRAAPLMSQLALLPGDHLVDTTQFPQGVRDVNEQQLDLRRHNSWLMRMHEVSTPELAEVLAINTMAPFILNSRLKKLMTANRPSAEEIAAQVAAATARAGALGGGAARGACSSTLAGAMLSSLDSASASADGATSTSGAPPRKRAHKEMQAAGASITGAQSKRVPANLCRFIVNVSAMEGKFHRHKLPTHPHTNMAKAALNMMTRTSAQDYAQDFIYMNACDTGWINDENPLERAVQTATRNNFQTPIDEIDAAARILDPVFQPLKDAEPPEGDGTCAPVFGAFLKDYFQSEW